MHVLLAYMPFQQMQCTSGELGGEVSDLLSPSSLSPWSISFARVMTFARAFRQPDHHHRYRLESSRGDASSDDPGHPKCQPKTLGIGRTPVSHMHESLALSPGI
jgi:hypothetical protein